MTPGISVVVPAYNLESWIGKTLTTVIEQTSLPDEVVVADDGSTDRTLTIVEEIASRTSIPFRILKGEHRGPGATRNLAIANATCEWIAFLDGDDEWDPRKVERVRETIAIIVASG